MWSNLEQILWMNKKSTKTKHYLRWQFLQVHLLLLNFPSSKILYQQNAQNPITANYTLSTRSRIHSPFMKRFKPQFLYGHAQCAQTRRSIEPDFWISFSIPDLWPNLFSKPFNRNVCRPRVTRIGACNVNDLYHAKAWYMYLKTRLQALSFWLEQQ